MKPTTNAIHSRSLAKSLKTLNYGNDAANFRQTKSLIYCLYSDPGTHSKRFAVCSVVCPFAFNSPRSHWTIWYVSQINLLPRCHMFGRFVPSHRWTVWWNESLVIYTSFQLVRAKAGKKYQPKWIQFMSTDSMQVSCLLDSEAPSIDYAIQAKWIFGTPFMPYIFRIAFFCLILLWH